MAVYVKEQGGYIADNPNIDFERCDGRVFSYDEINTASVSVTKNSVTITGGWGSFPLAYIDTDSSMEITFESSKFTLAMFEMANAVNGADGDFSTLETKYFDVEAGLKVTIPYEVQTGSVKINGQEEATTAAAGKFSVAITAASADTAGKAEVTFHEGDVTVGDTIRVSYRRRVVNAHRVVVKSTSTTAKGALYLHWPVYSSGTDCTEAGVQGYAHMCIPRVRATAVPGFNNSYKSASTNAVTFAAIDPKRADGKMYDLSFEPTDSNGDIVSKSSATVDWD